MSYSWRPVPAQREDCVHSNAEFVAPLSVRVPSNGSHDYPSSGSINDPWQRSRGNSSAGDANDGDRNCCCSTPKCRCAARTGLFAAQCSACFKWRLVPSKRVYEDIRQTVRENPFVCERAAKWNPRISCDVPDDILPGDHRIWGIDDTSDAPEPPPGWERLLRIRNQWWDYRFADVFYVAPNGKRVRTRSDVRRFFAEHPEYAREGLDADQFSFYASKPQLTR